MGIFKKDKSKAVMPALTRRKVDAMLIDTQRAEQPGIPQAYLDAGVPATDYPNLGQNATEDGAWACCSCLRETLLVHVKGPHPFEHLDCFDCGHILCQACETTDIIVPWDENRIDQPLSRTSELRVFQVCPGCGLSHRAATAANRLEKGLRWLPLASHFAACLCAEPAGAGWSKYMIGQPYTFRVNAERAKHACQERLARKKAEMLWERFEKQDEMTRERVDSVCAASLMVSSERRPDVRGSVGSDVSSYLHRDAVYSSFRVLLDGHPSTPLCPASLRRGRISETTESSADESSVRHESSFHEDVGEDLEPLNYPCSLYAPYHTSHLSKATNILPESPPSSPALAINGMRLNNTVTAQTNLSSTAPKNEEWGALYLLADQRMKLTEKAKAHQKTEQAEDNPFESLKWLKKNQDSGT